MNARHVAGLGDALREFLERLPGTLPQKQTYFNNRFHLRVPRTSYQGMWDGLGAPGNLPRAKYIFDYARIHLPSRSRELLMESKGGPVQRRAADPPITDLLFYGNGKLRKLGRLLLDYLPTQQGKTVAASIDPVSALAPPTRASTVMAPARQTKTTSTRSPNRSTATTETNDGEEQGWWRSQKRYEQIERIGKGGMGFVYKVRDTKTNRVWAAKVIDPAHRKDQEYQTRFSREVRAQMMLRHPNVLRIVEYGRDFYIAELCKESLATLLGRTRLSLNRALVLFDQATAGVRRAHTEKVLHRDLKPSNLLLKGEERLVVADFGLCRIDSSDFTTVTATRVRGGTYRYAAPEQWISLHRADHRADVFSLGVILQDLLTGTTALDVGDEEALTRIGADPFVSVVHRATHPDPARRYGSVDGLRRAVSEAQEATVVAPKTRR